jgi:nitrous oxidase accessory protein NosD
LIIEKKLTLIGISNEYDNVNDFGKPIIHVNVRNPVIYINASGCVFSGFELICNITNRTVMDGIMINKVSNNLISNNIINTASHGIHIIFGHSNHILGNHIEGHRAIRIDASNNLIESINIINNSILGVMVHGSFNTFKYNNFINNTRYGYVLINWDIPFLPTPTIFNRFIENYWDDWNEDKPRPINVRISLILYITLIELVIFYWNPATEPYDI